MKVLVLGNGGREHAITWALSRSQLVSEIHCARGNAGIGKLALLHPIDPEDADAVTGLARQIGADLVIIGPEGPLVHGVADSLRQAGFTVFGPGADGARLEGSKAFSKSFMARHGIPTAPFDICTTLEEARLALSRRDGPYVVKADGLAAGKGSFLLETEEEAEEICRQLLEERTLGNAGAAIVIEDHLPGWEVTILALTDGATYRMLPPSQDHKRAYDGDQGPNTGGMGAYTPVPQLDDALLEAIERQVMEPTIQGLQKEDIAFPGVIYAGIMVVEGIPLVLEYNIRFGDPETQVVLPVFPGDLAEACLACCHGTLRELPWESPHQSAVGVVMASGGYPGPYSKGFPVEGLDRAAALGSTHVFHAGTRATSEGGVETAGGRVLTVTGTGTSIEEALQRAYDGVACIDFRDAHYRRDIARKALPPTPQVGIVLGSASDLPKAEKTTEILENLGIHFEVTVASAHRTPGDAARYAANAGQRGLKVLIAFAGLSAALPGVLAAHTRLPVFGVPVESGALQGMDALLSIAQMPPGVPVGATGINGGRNAALLAARVIALESDDVAAALETWTERAAAKVVTSRNELPGLPSAPPEAFA